jgi:hypothetical protein
MRECPAKISRIHFAYPGYARSVIARRIAPKQSSLVLSLLDCFAFGSQ